MNPIRTICNNALILFENNDVVTVGIVLVSMVGFFGSLFAIGYLVSTLTEKYWLTK
jgi:hypothetical protein